VPRQARARDVRVKYLTRRDAAAVCGCSVDTLRHDEREGRLPNARKREDGTKEYAVADLLAIGRLDALAAGSTRGWPAAAGPNTTSHWPGRNSQWPMPASWSFRPVSNG
jgi:hypothetical protein